MHTPNALPSIAAAALSLGVAAAAACQVSPAPRPHSPPARSEAMISYDVDLSQVAVHRVAVRMSVRPAEVHVGEAAPVGVGLHPGRGVVHQQRVALLRVAGVEAVVLEALVEGIAVRGVDHLYERGRAPAGLGQQLRQRAGHVGQRLLVGHDAVALGQLARQQRGRRGQRPGRRRVGAVEAHPARGQRVELRRQPGRPAVAGELARVRRVEHDQQHVLRGVGPRAGRGEQDGGHEPRGARGDHARRSSSTARMSGGISRVSKLSRSITTTVPRASTEGSGSSPLKPR